MDMEKYYHRIYAEIVKLIVETYQIADSTKLVIQRTRNRLIYNLFKDHIKLQKISLKLNEKKKVLEGYLDFSNFATDEYFTYHITKKLWVTHTEN